MNHLAHALLAGDNEDLLLGGILGDFVHGQVSGELRVGVQAGIRLHRAIDVYTDSHPLVAQMRAAFVAPYRRYAGILIDVWFDHLLARDFARWSEIPLPIFSRRLMTVLLRHEAELPAGMRGFVAYMQRHDLPGAYRDRAMIARALAGIGMRLSRANPLATAMPQLDALAPQLETSFAGFFPQLQAFAEAWRARGMAAADPAP